MTTRPVPESETETELGTGSGAPGPGAPVAPVGRRWIAAFTVACTGMWLAALTPAQVQLARQAELIDPAGKELLFGLATGIGAGVTMLAVPLFGAASDRIRTPFGRRRPWIGGGALLAAVALVVLALGPTGPVLLVGGWALAQLGLAAVLAGLLATVPDRVPPAQLGTVAGWAGTSQMLGALLGTVLVNAVVPDLAGGYLAMVVVLLAALLPFLLLFPERPGGAHAAPAPARRTAVRMTPDMVWVWSGRFLVMLGFALVTQYLVYYVDDELGRPDVAGSVLVVTALTVVSAIVASLVSGRWSDRTGRRKVFVVGGGALMGLGASILASTPVWPLALVAAVLIGLGFGTFLAVDLAVVAQVLPSLEHTARDMGVFAVAATAPQLLAPAVAVPLVTGTGGYPVLYALTAVVTVLGGALVLGVRAVR
ncbi:MULTISPECIES: MFS transporter [Pseudonocardia]|uniref:Major Facilitator Superfamily protein n=2 Tax=Pseudonocardia TaxID=1847 RepID=A0A1Y2N5Q7_PSEAH|nr:MULTISPECIES: MFS transporter [Pseudonocardia]OSY42803.1 Major Facilitator Superfamily protein [Pseudonocardia autotrophica]TDN77380.1 MFS transporter [Pseudonocardia autotrophica]BBG01403.1 MFS transporter [Pseudonocardia autotrophica]GEC24459.1 MFS transporter [Pseudonocardia saturnea]